MMKNCSNNELCILGSVVARSTGDKEVVCSNPAGSCNIRSGLRSFFPFADSRWIVVSFWRKNVRKNLLTA